VHAYSKSRWTPPATHVVNQRADKAEKLATIGTSPAAEAHCLLCLVSPTSALEVEVTSLPAGGLGRSVPYNEHAVVTVHITFGGGAIGPGYDTSSVVDLPCGGRHVPDYVAILKGQAAMLGNPPQTALNATIPRTGAVSHGDKVCGSPGQLTVVALRNDEGDEDVDLANPNTYTLVRVWSESSETVTMPLCDSSLQLNNSLFCSLVAANRPCVSDTRTAIHLEPKTGMRDRACSAECPESTNTLNLMAMNTESADKLTHITLKVKDQDGYEVHFNVRPSTKFRKIFDAYCLRKGLEDEDSVRFRFDERRLYPDSTPSDEAMEDGDMIDLYIEQVGGMFVQSSGRDDNEPLTAEPPTATVDVTICIPGDKQVTVSIAEQQTFKEATALAVLQLQLEVAENRAAETNKTMADIKARMKELAGVD
jgi:hypothetical protein